MLSICYNDKEYKRIINIMRHAIIKSSQVAEYSRLDAKFHLAIDDLKKDREHLEGTINSLGDVITNLESQYSVDEMREMISEIRDEDKKSAAIILGRGHNDPKKAKYSGICDEYPYIAFALISRDIESAIVRVKAAIKNEKSYLKKLTNMGNTRKSKHEDPDPSNS